MNNEKLLSALKEAEEEIRSAMNRGEDLSKLVSISIGNNKMGKIASVSLLPVLTCPGRCNGTCGDKCYARKLALLRPSVLKAYARNTAIAKLAPVAFFNAVSNAMASARYFRFHVSGDIPNRAYLDLVAYLCKVHTHCEVLMFTKRYELVNKFIEDGNAIPENLHVLMSGWTNLDPINPHNLPETTVYATDADIRPEWTLCGGNCLDCAIHDGGCWAAKSGETIAFKIH